MDITTKPPAWNRLVGWFGLILLLPIGAWYAASGLVAPTWAVLVLLTIWLLLLAVAIVLLRRRPALVPVVPVVAILIWYCAIWAGGEWLRWTA